LALYKALFRKSWWHMGWCLMVFFPSLVCDGVGQTPQNLPLRIFQPHLCGFFSPIFADFSTPSLWTFQIPPHMKRQLFLNNKVYTYIIIYNIVIYKKMFDKKRTFFVLKEKQHNMSIYVKKCSSRVVDA